MEAEEEFAELVERALTRWHYTNTDGKVYAALLLSEEPLTIEEIASRTGLSRSSVSASLSRLVKDYLVTFRRRGKTKLFRAVPGFLEVFLRQPREHLEKEVRPLRVLAERLSKRKEKLAHVARDLRRLEEILEHVLEAVEGSPGETRRAEAAPGRG